MKLARMAAAPLLLSLCLPQACSDPPSPPAQGAVNIRIGPTPGGAICPTGRQHAPFSMPASEQTGVYSELLMCPLDQGCKPDKFIVVDRDNGATISCSVKESNGQFAVAITFSVNLSGSGGP